ncbi:hypothetical protein [Uliginosibacterium sp. H1]|uniref:hypothetical protein n=1 Tax=Uliginosibacterium sp. H1 TaxID=3114757 RepID=UPI002E16F217|nr:hypothetical protein [Uliginosibacterium sp. H1]
MKEIVERSGASSVRPGCVALARERGAVRGGLLVALGVSLGLHGLLLGWPDGTASQPEPVVGWKLSGVSTPLAVRFHAVAEPVPVPRLPPPAVSLHGDVAPTAPLPLEPDQVTQERSHPRQEEPARPAALIVEEPPRLLTPVYVDTVIGPDTAGFVIRFRIHVSAVGRAEQVEILDNWLDAAATNQLSQSLMDADYQPARRAGMAVAGILEGGLAIEAPDKKEGPAIADPFSIIPPR